MQWEVTGADPKVCKTVTQPTVTGTLSTTDFRQFPFPFRGSLTNFCMENQKELHEFINKAIDY